MAIVKHLGNDRVVMIVCFLIGMARGTNYSFQPGNSDLVGHMILLDDYVPVWTFGALWYVAGLLALAGLFLRALRPWVYGLFIGLASLSALTFVASWLIGFSPSGFVSAMSYGGKAVFLYLLGRTPSIGDDKHLYESNLPTLDKEVQ